MEQFFFGQVRTALSAPKSAHSSAARRRSSRRGAEAIEFALVLPMMLTIIFATFDYGLFFWERFQVNNVVHRSLRTGTLYAPTDAERVSGGCVACQTAVGDTASEALASIGVNVPPSDLQPEIVSIAGVCAFTLTATIPHASVTGLFNVPTSYTIRSATPAQQVPVCN